LTPAPINTWNHWTANIEAVARQFTVVSAVLVATAWTLYFRGHGNRSIAIALVLASVLVVTAASWNLIESPLLKIVRASR
jgi:uncharacterized membrane protein